MFINKYDDAMIYKNMALLGRADLISSNIFANNIAVYAAISNHYHVV